MDERNLIIEKTGHIARVIVNRPKVLNALNRKTVEELDDAFKELGSDPSIKVLILTGAGEKSFVAGADINEVSGYDPTEGALFAHHGQSVLNRIENLGKPVIAAINGFALGGGCEIAMACHIRVASNKARLGQPEILLGIIPGFGGTQRLARLIGEGRAMELVLTGDQISAEEAYRMGLLNKVVPPEALQETVTALAQKLAAKGALTLRYAMDAVHHGLQTSLAEGLNLEANLFAMCCATEDKREGTRAFLEKRPPNFKDK
jgi:enoyl-CoA hydratase